MISGSGSPSASETSLLMPEFKVISINYKFKHIPQERVAFSPWTKLNSDGEPSVLMMDGGELTVKMVAQSASPAALLATQRHRPA